MVESCRKSKGGQFCGYVKPAAWTRALTLRPLPVKSCWRSSPNSRLLFWSCRLQLRHSRRSSSSCSGGLRLWKERPSLAAPGECLGSSPNRASGPPGRNRNRNPRPHGFARQRMTPSPAGGACAGGVSRLRHRAVGRLDPAHPGGHRPAAWFRRKLPSTSISPGSARYVSNAAVCRPADLAGCGAGEAEAWGSTCSA